MTRTELAERVTISVEEAGEALGISRGAAYAAAREGTIPTVRFGRRLIVPVSRLLDLLDAASLVDH